MLPHPCYALADPQQQAAALLSTQLTWLGGWDARSEQLLVAVLDAYTDVRHLLAGCCSLTWLTKYPGYVVQLLLWAAEMG
jgi:hypothetical protein